LEKGAADVPASARAAVRALARMIVRRVRVRDAVRVSRGVRAVTRGAN